MESVLLQQKMQSPLVLIYLMHEEWFADTLWILKQDSSNLYPTPTSLLESLWQSTEMVDAGTSSGAYYNSWLTK